VWWASRYIIFYVSLKYYGSNRAWVSVIIVAKKLIYYIDALFVMFNIALIIGIQKIIIVLRCPIGLGTRIVI